jgi:hypothetical protein
MADSKAVGYGIVGAGIVLAWAGLNNKSVLATFQDLVAGKQPTPGPGYKQEGTFLNTIGGNATPGANLGVGNPVPGNIQQYAQQMLTQRGWGSQWASFNALEQGEGGWNPNATNPSSKAFGLAQALGHGTANTRGSLSNMYGGYGLSVTEAQQANSGSAQPQLKWMMNYIAAVYGNPNNAYARWLSRNPHWY